MLGGFETAQGHNAQPQCGVMFGVLLQVTMFLESVRLQQWTWSRPVVLTPDGPKPLWYLRRKNRPLTSRGFDLDGDLREESWLDSGCPVSGTTTAY
jgi:hypothetical protein